MEHRYGHLYSITIWSTDLGIYTLSGLRNILCTDSVLVCREHRRKLDTFCSVFSAVKLITNKEITAITSKMLLQMPLSGEPEIFTTLTACPRPAQSPTGGLLLPASGAIEVMN